MENKLLKIINEIKENRGEDKVEALSSEMNLRDDLNFDSFALAELTVHVEVEFDVDIFEDGIVTTISDVLEKLK